MNMQNRQRPFQSRVHVQEAIPLKPEYATWAEAYFAAQAYDDTADSNAHRADGYIDHAQFFFLPASASSTPKLLIQYLWRDAASLGVLLEQEKTILAEWFERYTSAPREVVVMEKIPVDI